MDHSGRGILYPGGSLPPCRGLWGTLNTGDDLIVVLVSSWSAKSRTHQLAVSGFLGNSKGMVWQTESKHNMDVYKFCMTKHVSLASLTG